MKYYAFFVLAVSFCFGQLTSYQNEELNYQYTAPPGWYIDEGDISNYGEFITLSNPSYITGLEWVMVVVRNEDDTVATKENVFSRYFGIIKGEWDGSTSAPQIPFIEDTVINSIEYTSLEVVGDIWVHTIYSQRFQNICLQIDYLVTINNYDTNREEFYKNFQNLQFLSTSSSTSKKRSSKDLDIQTANKKIFFDLLGRKSPKGKYPKVPLLTK